MTSILHQLQHAAQGKNGARYHTAYDARKDIERWANHRLVRHGEHGPPPSQHAGVSGPPVEPSSFGVEHQPSLSQVQMVPRGVVPAVDGIGAQQQQRLTAVQPVAPRNYGEMVGVALSVLIILYFLA
jgi:hypothetical protein